MHSWAPLWSSIVESSIWSESDSVCKVFVTLLALKDSDHIVRKTAYQLAKLCNKDELEVLDCLRILAEPDRLRKEKQPYEGRRIQLVEDGWLVLNGDVYREKVRDEMRKAKNRRAQAAWRERQRGKKSKPLPGELSYLKTGVMPEVTDKGTLRETPTTP